MVQSSTLLIAAFTLAPVLAAPVNHIHTHHHHQHQHTPRAADAAPAPAGTAKHAHHTHTHHAPQSTAAPAPAAAPADLAARDPFSFKKAFRKIGKVASTAAGVGLKVAPLLALREDSESDLEMRAPDLLEDGNSEAAVFFRDEDGSVYIRDFSVDISELDARDPFSFKKAFRKIGKVASSAARVATKVGGTAAKFAPLLALRDELEDGSNVLLERDVYFDLDDLLERSGDDGELEARFNFGSFFNKAKNTANKVKHTASNVLKTVDKVSGQAHKLGLRELDPAEELELDARFNLGSWFGKAKDTANQVSHTASHVLNTVDKVSGHAHKLGLREIDGEGLDVEAREESIDDMD